MTIAEVLAPFDLAEDHFAAELAPPRRAGGEPPGADPVLGGGLQLSHRGQHIVQPGSSSFGKSRDYGSSDPGSSGTSTANFRSASSGTMLSTVSLVEPSTTGVATPSL